MSPLAQFRYQGATGWRLPHTLSTILNARAASGKLSLLTLASSPGAFIAPQIARRLRSARG
jgi:cyanate permease